MTYRKFDCDTWTDPWVEALPPEAKLLFVYAWTNNSCNHAGVYQLTRERIKFDCGVDIEQYADVLKDKLEWDSERSLLWVKNFFKHQCQNASFATAALKDIAEFDHDVQEKWHRHNKGILSEHGVDTMPTPCLDHATTTLPEQNRTEQNRNTPCRQSAAEPFLDDFEAWYFDYPRKGDKRDALKAYQARRREKDGEGKPKYTADQLTLSRDNYKAKLKREKTDQRYIKLAKTFLGPGGHVDEYLELPPPPKTCGTCQHGGDEPTYCLIAMQTVGPDEPPCKDYKGKVK